VDDGVFCHGFASKQNLQVVSGMCLLDALLMKTVKYALDLVCLVGNPAMQQLFLGLPVENLTQ